MSTHRHTCTLTGINIVVSKEGRSRFTKHLAWDTSLRNEDIWGVAQGVVNSVHGTTAEAPDSVHRTTAKASHCDLEGCPGWTTV